MFTMQRTRVKQTRKKHGGRTKKMVARHCSPYAKSKGIYGCFTREALFQMRDAFNQQKSDKTGQISGNDPVKIWNQLREKIPQCSQETCWVESLSDVAIKKKLRKQLFVPVRPTEWAANPNAWLSNFDIAEVMHQYAEAYPSFKFIDPVSIDFAAKPSGVCIGPELCSLNVEQVYKSGIREIGTVINLDTHDGPGTHWVSVFIRLPEHDAVHVKSDGAYFFYFNSTGAPATPEIVAFWKNIEAQSNVLFTDTPMVYHESRIEHQKSNTECGVYSLVFLVSMLTKEHPQTKPNSGQNRFDLNKFKTKRIPDKVVEQYRHIYFR